jgi:hypothetical protein
MNKNSIYWIVIVIVIIGIIGALFVRTYTSSPGFTTTEYAKEFYRNAPKCYGLSLLLNREATYADAPGKSLCIGWLGNSHK